MAAKRPSLDEILELQRLAAEYLDAHPCTGCGTTIRAVKRFTSSKETFRPTVNSLIFMGVTPSGLQAEMAQRTVMCCNCTAIHYYPDGPKYLNREAAENAFKYPRRDYYDGL